MNTVKKLRNLNEYFSARVEVSRARYGKSQDIEMLINEEAFLLAQYLRDEKQTWIPRTPLLTFITAI